MTQIENLFSTLTDVINNNIINNGAEECVIITAKSDGINILFWTPMIADEPFKAIINGTQYDIEEFHYSSKNNQWQLATPAGFEEKPYLFFNIEELENVDELIKYLNNLK